MNHTQSLPEEHISDENTECSKLFRKYVSASITFDEADFSGRYAWVETVEDQRLVYALRRLSEQDLELLTFLVIEGHTQQELAGKWGCSQAAVSKRYKKI